MGRFSLWTTDRVMGRRSRSLNILTATLPLVTGILGLTTLTLTPMGAVRAAVPVQDDFPMEAAKTSRVTGLSLPAGGVRILKQDMVEGMTKTLRTTAEENGFVTGKPEAIIWGGKDYKASRNAEIERELVDIFKKNNYKFEKLGEKEDDGVKIVLFVAGKPDAKVVVFGYFAPQPNGFLLAMTKLAKKGTPLEDEPVSGANSGSTTRPSSGNKNVSATEKARLTKELGKAVEAKNVDEVKSLLTRGADPNGRQGEGEFEQAFLQRAVIVGNVEIVTLLLEAGANPNYGNGKDIAPLFTAALVGAGEILDVLLEKGANPNATLPDNGMTPLHGAAITGRADMIERLLAKGADPKIRDKSGRTPRQIAENTKKTEAASLLKEAEQKPVQKSAGPSGEDSGRQAAAAPQRPSTPAPSAVPAGAITVDVAPSVRQVNVMKSARPKAPSFPSLTPKAGYVRGYVYDANGKPLKGALLGVRSTSSGGFYSGASSKSDARGYYEIQVPFGVAHFYCAGYAVPYGEGKAALGLSPVDQEDPTFASNKGAVQNFVLFGYGIADPDGIQNSPQYAGNYFGGSFILDWNVDDDDRFAQPKYLPKNATIEVTLTPEGPLTDGSQGRPIVIRKKLGEGSFGQLWVNNIPVGVYRISARLAGGGPLKMKETGPYSSRPFGIEGKEAVGSAGFTFRPGSADPNSATSGHGNWDAISVSLERP